MLRQKTLLVRVEAGRNVGFGHAMRCLALAQAWENHGGRAVFHMGDESTRAMEGSLGERFERSLSHGNPGSPDDAAATAELSRKIEADWVVVDGYQFGGDYQSLLKASCSRLLWIDDYGHAAPYVADIVLNQNTSADEAMYADRSPGVHVLSGPRYALLRREFWRWRCWQRDHRPAVMDVLITLGGGDSTEIVHNMVDELEGISKESGTVFTVIAGFMSAGNPTPDAETMEPPLRRRHLESVGDMPSLMAKADLAISAGGSTCWEMAFMGLPAIVCPLAMNQEGVAVTLSAMGVVKRVNYGDPSGRGALIRTFREMSDDAGLRRRMSDAGRRLVDGMGGFRVVETMREAAA